MRSMPLSVLPRGGPPASPTVLPGREAANCSSLESYRSGSTRTVLDAPRAAPDDADEMNEQWQTSPHRGHAMVRLWDRQSKRPAASLMRGSRTHGADIAGVYLARERVLPSTGHPSGAGEDTRPSTDNDAPQNTGYHGSAALSWACGSAAINQPVARRADHHAWADGLARADHRHGAGAGAKHATGRTSEDRGEDAAEAG